MVYQKPSISTGYLSGIKGFSTTTDISRSSNLCLVVVERHVHPRSKVRIGSHCFSGPPLPVTVTKRASFAGCLVSWPCRNSTCVPPRLQQTCPRVGILTIHDQHLCPRSLTYKLANMPESSLSFSYQPTTQNTTTTLPAATARGKTTESDQPAMQAGKSAMEATKEAAANLGASANAGMQKTRAAVQGQVEKATAHNASDKAAAEANQRERVRAAEEEKQSAMRANAAAKERAAGAHPSQGAPGIVDAAAHNQQGHGAAPAGGHVEDGVGETRPVARGTGTARPSAAHNPHVGSDFPQARGTGGQYQ